MKGILQSVLRQVSLQVVLALMPKCIACFGGRLGRLARWAIGMRGACLGSDERHDRMIFLFDENV